MTETVRVSELGLGDVVRLDGDAPFGDGVVTRVTAEEVTVFRPYAMTADFSYVGGVIPYIGMETVRFPLPSERAIARLRKGVR